mgnify:FL=1
MTVQREYSPAGVLWISIVSMVVGVVAALVTVGIFSGRLDARVASLEAEQAQAIQRGEWSQFEKDIRSRLDRIEDKLDSHRENERR